MKNKYFILTLTVLSLLFSIKFIPVSALTGSDTLNLEESIKSASNKNSELSILNKKIEICDEKYKKSLDEKNDGAETSIETLRKGNVYPLQRKKELEDAKWNYEEKRNDVILDTERLYYLILIQQELIDNEKNQVDRLENLLNQKKKEVELGSVSKNSLRDYELSLESAKNKLQEFINEKNKLVMELNLKIGNPVRKELYIKNSNIPCEDLNEINLDNIINELIKKHHSIYSIEAEIEYTKNDKNNFIDINSNEKYDDDIKDLEDKLIELNYNLEDAKKDLEYKVISNHNTILNLKNSIEIKNLDYENKKSLLDSVIKKQKLGMATNSDYKIALENLNNALADYKKSQLEYYIAIQKFKFFIKCN
ncbi:outer membrane efflux protein [Clostridium acetireducens DSM 10703]|jgi:hypothetical protein|uniref:Outer membrane efflux protein n=1 Tax=Clostridium acetireducens DSM 10703 TaxID=1121290 RepID=A0A1E8F1C6_9CLOT|nr:TolC family protein [Clostridium acetireducens]OFI06984.1 outer membrane efflux protein [Clostridium acetireducens DSM 10703]